MSPPTTQNLKQKILSLGVDLVGVARADSLILAHPQRPATALMPTAESVIVMAVAHSLGAVYSPDIMLWTRNKMQTSRLLDMTAESIARELEAVGYLSLPVSADKPVEIHKRDPETGMKFPQTRVLGHLSLKHAAMSAGLGAIGKSNLLLTPEFGPHQRLCAIITEAPLTPDVPTKDPICLKSCKKCRKACPVGALTDEGYDVDACFNYWAYGLKKKNPVSKKEWPGFVRLLLRHVSHRGLLVEFGQTFITDVDNCIECMRACRVGSHWKTIRPDILPDQKTPGGSF